jgi:hypothetical protein
MTKTKKNQPKEVVDSVQETTQDATNQGAPFEENVPAPEPEPKEEAFSLEPKKDKVFSLEPTKENLPSLDEIKAKERALRKR